MNWLFYINGTQIVEPVGWDKLKIKLDRSQHHGINFVYSANELGFTCANVNGLTGGYHIIKEAFESDLYLTTPLILRVEYSCNGIISLLSEFNLNLSGYRESLADGQIFVNIEQTGARQQLANNYELPINYFATQDVSGNPYTRPPEALQTVHLPPLSYWTQNLLSYYEDESYIVASSLNFTVSTPYVAGNYYYGHVRFNNVQVDEPDDFAYNAFAWMNVGPSATGQFIATGKIDVTLTVASWYGGTPFPAVLYAIKCVLNINGVDYDPVIVWSGADPLGINVYSFTYDASETIASIPYPSDIRLYIGVDSKATVFGSDYQNEIHFDCVFNNGQTANYLEVIEQNQIDLPDGVDLPAILINEAFSVPVELVSGQQMTMQSRILGRTDSYPFTQAENGAWSIVAILSGLMLRRFPAKSENVGYDPYTYSIKELFEAVRAFFPVGWGFLGEQMIIEAIPYFYQDDIAITIEAGERAGALMIELDKEKTYNRARIGVENWKIDGYNALEEINTITSYSTDWQSVNNQFDATGKIYTQQSRIIQERQKDFRSNPGDAEDSTDFYALWIDRTTINDPIKEVLQGLVSGSKIKDINSVINFSFNPAESMRRYKVLYLNNAIYYSGGEGNTEAQGATINVGQVQAVSYPESTIFYTSTYSEPYSPVNMNQSWLGGYRRYMKLRVKGYIPTSDFTELLSNPYRRIQVNVGNDAYLGWIESLTYEPNSNECELELIYF